MPATWLAALAALPSQSARSVSCLLSEIDAGLLTEQRNGQTLYPARELFFYALCKTPPDAVKAVILGQDPYHGGQAHGLSFSVLEGVKRPPSLRNIFTELHADVGVIRAEGNNDLSDWSEQGVLLLNSILSVRAGEAGAHAALGWSQLTDLIIQVVSAQRRACVFFLWGNSAGSKAVLIDGQVHLVISSAHPSPLSAYRGFFGSRPFSRCNAFLSNQGRQEIDWL